MTIQEKIVDYFKDKKTKLIYLLDKEVDLIDLSDANIILKHQIVTTGKNLFCRTKLEKDEFKYGVISCYYQYREDIEIVKKSIKKRGYVWKK